jgi:ABC-type polysaccharide/polyol phosphate transport system ATPase subunit
MAAVSEKPTLLPVSERPSIRVEDLAVTYRVSLDSRPTLRGALMRVTRREQVTREVRAVKDVSFEIPHGRVVGVVGHNGAGKSTLVRALAGILAPTRGRVEVHGTVSTLLSLGVGFNRRLTGRENVTLGGLAAGLSREEMAARYEEIVAFAELEDYMDMPMRTYSSGMYGRLAFAVAVHMEPDILLIDEALSVGDARFKRKSARRMRKLCAQARTLVIVSHAMGTIRDLCHEAIWLDHGEMQMHGDVEEVTRAYTASQDGGENDGEPSAGEGGEEARALDDEAVSLEDF